MPQIIYSQKHEAFIKQCSTCEKEYVGAHDELEAEKVLKTFFHRGSDTEDGFKSSCRSCRRRQNYSTLQDVDTSAMYKEQQGKCALCCVDILEHSRFSGDPLGAHMDHSHRTGKIRGLLCPSCNLMIGFYETILERNPQFDIYAINVYLRGDE